MTQLDLPQLSLRRYLDLVKRRRWQVVPVSLLGLLIGGLVAFFIPRMFVAETRIKHAQMPGEGQDSDAVKQIVETAKSAIPTYVEEAIGELNWTEFNALDEFDRGQFARDVESRVKVLEQFSGDRNRGYAIMLVQYRDRDGDRSAQLLNKLVEVWIRGRTEEMRVPARERSRLANEKADRWFQAMSQCRRDKQQLELQYGIDPRFLLGEQEQLYNDHVQRQEIELKALEQLKVAHSKLAARINSQELELAELQARVPPSDGDWLLAASKDPKLASLVVRALNTKRSYESSYNPGTLNWYVAKRQFEFEVAAIKALLPKVEVDRDGLVPNPKHQELLLKIQQSRLELDVMAAEIATKAQLRAEEQKRLTKLKDGFRIYGETLEKLDEAEKAREAALEEAAVADGLDAAMTRELPVTQMRRALPPPAPTEPNILLVALIGCGLGLLAAIALILLLDFLQGSFKTMDEVERGLGVPVLGGVSHLETEMERMLTARSRRRVSLVLAAALLMVTAIVIVFYLDPNRLPTVVRDILRVLLLDT